MSLRGLWRGALLLGAALASALALAAGSDLQPVPALTAHVIDQTGTLDAAQRGALETKLQAFEGTTGSQMVIVLVPTTQPEDIADYTQRLGDAWKIGRKGVGDGLLIVVAKNDRTMRIAPAKALEGAVPDLAAKQIIDRTLTPAFRAGDFAGGLGRAVDELSARVRGEALPPPAPRGGEGSRPGFGLDQIAIFFFVGVPILGAVLTGMFGRKLGALATGGAAGVIGWWLSTSLLLAGAAGLIALFLVGVMGIGAARRGGPGMGPIVWGGGHGGWGGGGGFGGGGGGFSSGGGGDFGGGGASGRW